MSDRVSPRLDLSKMRFPTDRITIGQLRAEQPDIYMSENLRRMESVDANVFATMITEIEFAETAFAKALGLPAPHPKESQQERISWLNDDYKRYGISTGAQATRQLAREIEKAAVEQAKQFRAR
jgi:hypothetical protein